MKHCPTCGAFYGADERFCEADGATLVVDTIVAPSPQGSRCLLCGEGTLEPDGFCSACGRRSTGPMPPTVRAGASLAGGVVIESIAGDEHLVRLVGKSAPIRVVLGEAATIEREAGLLERIGGTGPFPRLVEHGRDEALGAYLALATPAADARPLREVGPRFDMAAAIHVVRELMDAARIIEAQGYAWEPQRDDVRIAPNGSLAFTRLRVARKLWANERLDARSIVETIGSTFVPTPAIDGPSRAFRLLLPHTAIPGDPGSTVDDVRIELAAFEGDLPPPPNDGERIAGVCDPGLRRSHNEDAMASASGITNGERWTVLVVCDGVSSSSHAEQAASIASIAARDALAHFARSGDVAFESGGHAVAQAIRAAHLAVCAQIKEEPGDDPPGTTIVVGLIWRQRLTVGWVGDSRAYWISETGAELLTTDHSWANEAVARGEVTEEEAMMAPLAHALTRCLGPLEIADDEESAGRRSRIHEVQPEVRARDLPGPGWVVLCSDGFWNYFPTAAQVAHVLRAAGTPTTAARVARRLVNVALARGGQDNTTTLIYEHR